MEGRNDIFDGYGELEESAVERHSPKSHDIFSDYTGPDNPNPVRVAFEMSEKVWNTVVVDGDEEKSVESEGSSSFVVEYASSADFTDALSRFDGMVPYTVLNDSESHVVAADEIFDASNDIKAGSWVVSNNDSLQRRPTIAKVKEAYDDPLGGGELLLDLVIYSSSGKRIGRVSDPMGGPKTFEPACASSLWEPIAPPDFEKIGESFFYGDHLKRLRAPAGASQE